MGEYMGDYYGVVKWDTRRLDYSSYYEPLLSYKNRITRFKGLRAGTLLVP